MIKPTKVLVELVSNNPVWATRKIIADDARILNLEKALMTAITIANNPVYTALKRSRMIVMLDNIRTKGKTSDAS